MSQGIYAEVKGLAEFKAKMRALGPELAGETLEKGLRAAGDVFAEAVKERAKGRLAEDVGVEISIAPSGLAGLVRIGFKQYGWIARLVEFGHRMVGHKPDKKEVGRVPAHPFVRPAYDTANKRAIDALVGALKNAFRR